MVRRRARLSAGPGWTAFLRGQRHRPGLEVHVSPLDEGDAERVETLEQRIKALQLFKRSSDRARVAAALPDTMELLRSTAHLQGHELRERQLRKVIEWALGTRS